ncbi:MAG: SPOR domain-containing protein [Spirochaetota bacterium]|nr:SPOR domain-containing protein [Spirochaetota bacterium]
MENYTDKENKKVKEKDVYLLHLDIPRIIIISCTIIGIVIISFLIGMNINKDTENDNPLHDQSIFSSIPDPTDKLDMFNNNGTTPHPVDDEITLNRSNDLKPSLPNNIIDFNAYKNNAPPLAETEEKSSDILTSENIKNVIPPVKDVLESSSNKTIKKKNKYTPQKAKKKKKARVVEVAKKKKKKRNFSSVSRGNKKQYAIQVASYDKRSKAISETNHLDRLRYDSFIEKAQINGKKYFRVRVGPIYSKKKALTMLSEIQETTRYGESFMVKQ